MLQIQHICKEYRTGNLIQKALDDVGDKISADEKAQVQADIDALKALVEKTDAENVCGDEPEKGQWFWQCPFSGCIGGNVPDPAV